MEGENSTSKKMKFLVIVLTITAVTFVGIFILYKPEADKSNNNLNLEDQDERSTIERTVVTTTKNNPTLEDQDERSTNERTNVTTTNNPNLENEDERSTNEVKDVSTANNNPNLENEDERSTNDKTNAINENTDYVFSRKYEEKALFINKMYSSLIDKAYILETGPVNLEYDFVKVNINDKNYILRYDTETAQTLLANNEKLEIEKVNDYLVLEPITEEIVERIHSVNGFDMFFDIDKRLRIKERLIVFIYDKLNIDLSEEESYSYCLTCLYKGLINIDYNLGSSFERLELRKDLQFFRRINTLLDYLCSVITTKKIGIDDQKRIVLSDIDYPKNSEYYKYLHRMLPFKNCNCDQQSIIRKLSKLLENKK